MDKPNSKFPTMGTSAATGARNASAEGTTNKLVKRKNTAAGDPTATPTAHRSAVKSTGGAAYGIRTTMPAWNDPHIGPTQGNGRIVPAAVNRSKLNFSAGIEDHN